MAKKRPATNTQERHAAEAALQLLLDALESPKRRQRVKRSRQIAGPIREQVRRWNRVGEILGYGVGLKQVGGLPTRHLSLQIHVRHKRPLDLVPPVSLIPPEVTWPGLPLPALLDVVEMAPFRLAALDDPQRPIFPGVSVGHCITGETGSLGAIVRALADTQSRYLLSAGHVLAASGRAKPGDDIIQPGGLDGGRCPIQRIGQLTEFVPLQAGPGFPNRADAALAKIDPGVGVKVPFRRLATPAEVKIDDVLFRVGCRTGRRPVLVENPSFATRLEFPLPNGGRASFGFQSLILYRDFSQKGDSGGPVMTSSDALVGIHIARNEDGFGLAVPVWSLPPTWKLAI